MIKGKVAAAILKYTEEFIFVKSGNWFTAKETTCLNFSRCNIYPRYGMLIQRGFLNTYQYPPRVPDEKWSEWRASNVPITKNTETESVFLAQGWKLLKNNYNVMHVPTVRSMNPYDSLNFWWTGPFWKDLGFSKAFHLSHIFRGNQWCVIKEMTIIFEEEDIEAPLYFC